MEISRQYLTPNPYSRPGTKLGKVTKIAVHYVGNPGSTAQNNRNYFNNMPTFPEKSRRYVSSHYVIGLAGEIIQCIPEEEISYCTNQANPYSISIEACHPDASGKFNPATEEALVELCADLCGRYGLDPAKDLIRHYDVTGKVCPKWYVDHPEAWEAFKGRVAEKLAPERETLYRVQVGAFSRKENAAEMLEKLKEAGFDGYVKEA